MEVLSAQRRDSAAGAGHPLSGFVQSRTLRSDGAPHFEVPIMIKTVSKPTSESRSLFHRTLSSPLVPGLRVLGFGSDPGHRGRLRAGLILPFQRHHIGSNWTPCFELAAEKPIPGPNRFVAVDVVGAGSTKRAPYAPSAWQGGNPTRKDRSLADM